MKKINQLIKKEFILLVFFMSVFSNYSYSQNKQNIEGQVIGASDGIPIPSASVLIKNSKTGTVTDFDGNFSLSVMPNDVLVVSFVGYKTVEVSVSNQKSITISLEEDVNALDEVVVVGYGTQKKSDITGSVAVVDMDALPVKSPITVAQTLQGAAPGVQVSNSGAPGSAPLIRIRGISSFGGNAPLYIIDGVPAVANADFNPHEIESIQILKDAAAASIYGSRAANGVILITTKKGKGKFSVEFDSRYGIEQVPKKIDMMSSAEFAALDNLAHDNAGIPHNPASDLTLSDPNAMPNTDWQGSMFQPGAIQDYNLAVNASTENSTYRVALGYLDQEGVINGPSFNRSSLNFNSTHTHGKFSLGSSVRMTATDKRSVVGNPFFETLTALPNVAVYDKYNVGGFGAGSDFNQTYFTNPIGAQLANNNTSHTQKFAAILFGEYQFTDAFKYRLTTSYDQSNSRYIGKREAAYLRYKDNPVSALTENVNHWYDWVFNHTFTYDKTFGDHAVTAVGVYAYEGYKGRSSNAYGENVTQDGTGKYFWVLSATQENQRVSGGAGEIGLHSGIARINYSFADKYLLQVSGRYDYSSQFSKDNRGAFFPAASIGWKIDKEGFMENADNVNLLKLRIGYGQLGGKNIGAYDYTGFINSSVNYVLGPNQELANGSTQIKIANPDLIWETTASTNIGIDYAFYNNRLQGSLEVYQTDTKDAILPVDIPLSVGNFGGNPNQNIGDIRNSGIELGINYRNMDNEFKYRIGLNASHNNNEVMDLGSLGELAGNMTMTRPGYAIGTFYLRETDGIWQVDEQAEAVQYGAAPGDVHYIDQNDDFLINDDDRIMMGNPFPKADIGLNFYTEYKGFDFSVFFFSQLGHDIYWGQGYVLNRTDDYMNHLAGMETWTPENKSNTTAIALYGSAGSKNNYGPQDRFLYDGDYVKLKNIELGFNIPNRGKIGFEKLRVYVSAQNLFTITDYPGYDPEVVNGWILERGVDWGSFPNPRTISWGIQAKF
ncbi:MAG: TonB-dependent receptor [Flavobacteriales bacterium]|nr:TonB-dependent receptor [Flavobacteriales bacterium]